MLLFAASISVARGLQTMQFVVSRLALGCRNEVSGLVLVGTTEKTALTEMPMLTPDDLLSGLTVRVRDVLGPSLVIRLCLLEVH